jgi:hypothetical protein
VRSEIFGVSEDESAFDHSADADNGKTSTIHAVTRDFMLNKTTSPRNRGIKERIRGPEEDQKCNRNTRVPENAVRQSL